MWSIKKTIALFSIITFTMLACTPEDGETGPAGPVGPEGAIGPAGTDGQDGTSFTSTTMNFVVDTTDWNMGRAVKANVDITQDVVDRGVVLAFRTPNPPDANSTWTSLFDGTFNYSYERGNVIFLTPGFIGANFITYYKVVVIPPSQKIDGFEPKTYEEAKMVYGFED